MIDPVPPIAKCPNCGTTMEISFDTHGPTGERPLYIQTGDLLTSQPSPKAGSDPDILRSRNEQRAARLTVQRWSQEEGYPSYTNSDKSDTAFLDTLIPAPLSEQLLPYLALVAVILGFIALCSLYFYP